MKMNNQVYSQLVALLDAADEHQKTGNIDKLYIVMKRHFKI